MTLGSCGVWRVLAVALLGGFATARAAQAEGAAPPVSVAPPADVAAPPATARRTKSGLALEMIERGTGARHPERNDCVRLRYLAWSRDGQLAGRSSNDAEGELQCLRQMSPGFAEAVGTMVIAQRVRLWIPKALAFPPNLEDDEPPGKQADLTYDVTLVALIPAPAPPKALKAPPPNARKLASGVAILTLKKGRGGASANDASHVKTHLSGWKSDGTLFESTVMAGQPVTFGMRELASGLRDGVRQMQLGERALLWIPAKLAYGEKPRRRGPPAGNLVYEVELLELGP